MKVLITGCAGLIGSSLANWIVSRLPNSTVVGIDNLSGGYREHIDGRVTFIQGDILNLDINSIIGSHQMDYVFHFAAYAAEGLSPFIRTFNYTNNLVATAKIVNECIRNNVKRLIFTSSMAVYGKGPVPFDEDQTPEPVDPYGIAKLACELDIKVAGEQHGLDWCILRPHNVYGPRQNIWDRYRNVLGIWMYQKLNNQPMVIFGDGEQKRAFSYIDDCLPAMWNAAIDPSASKEIINLGGIREYRIIDAAKCLQGIIGDVEIVHKESRHEVKHAWATFQKSYYILKYTDITPLRFGLLKMWNWAKQQPKRSQLSNITYELDKGMYDSWK